MPTIPSNFDGSKFLAKYTLNPFDFRVDGNQLYCPSLPDLTNADLLDCVITPAEAQQFSKLQLLQQVINKSNNTNASRLFPNPNNLSPIIVDSRIAALDQLASTTIFDTPIDGIRYVVVKSTTLTDVQINNALSPAQTPAETSAINDYVNAITDYKNIDADLASKSASELIILFDASWFSGKTLAQIQADINGSANYKAAMNQLVTYLFAFRDNYCHKQIQATVALRNRLIGINRTVSSSQQTPNKI